MKLFILAFVIIAILLTFLKSNFEGNLYNGDKWNNYRLGDVYLNTDKITNLNYHKKDYPGSIAAEILETTPYQPENKELLLKIISLKRKGIDKTTNSDLVLHIRVGDVLCSYNKTKTWYSRKNDLQWWARVLEYIRLNNIKRVFIVSGTHFKECLQESEEYLENRKNFLIKNIPGLDIIFRLGKSPDDDFIFFLDAQHFISTGGGFGRIIYEINGNEF